MQLETLDLENGYSGTFALVEGPENPLRFDEGHPPAMVRSWGRCGWNGWDNYGTGLNAWELFQQIPAAVFLPDRLPDTLAKLRLNSDRLDGMEDIAEDAGEVRGVVWDALVDMEFTDRAATLATFAELAGLPYKLTTSNGYSQGDSAEIFSVILPQWAEKVGCPPDDYEPSLESVTRETAAWIWGNVWQLESLTRPDGTEGETENFDWIIYGDLDDKESGALDCLTQAAEADAKSVAAETAEADHWAARDSVTVPA